LCKSVNEFNGKERKKNERGEEMKKCCKKTIVMFDKLIKVSKDEFPAIICSCGEAFTNFPNSKASYLKTMLLVKLTKQQKAVK
jgi:hypothetical protein